MRKTKLFVRLYIYFWFFSSFFKYENIRYQKLKKLKIFVSKRTLISWSSQYNVHIRVRIFLHLSSIFSAIIFRVNNDRNIFENHALFCEGRPDFYRYYHRYIYFYLSIYVYLKIFFPKNYGNIIGLSKKSHIMLAFLWYSCSFLW